MLELRIVVTPEIVSRNGEFTASFQSKGTESGYKTGEVLNPDTGEWDKLGTSYLVPTEDWSQFSKDIKLSDYTNVKPGDIIKLRVSAAGKTAENSVTVNKIPNAPSFITIPDTIRGGKDTFVIWSAATDPDGNLEGYIVERSYNGGSSWEQVYQGRSTSTTVSVPFGTQTIMFRVQSYDTFGAKSGWTTSPNRVVINNRAPAAPPSISVPLSPSGGDKLTITWTASTDSDGNLEGYELERQWDGAV